MSMILGGLEIANDIVLDFSDIKLLHNTKIIIRVVNFNKIGNNNSFQYNTVDVVGRICGFKSGSYFSQDELYFLILLRNNINLNFNNKSIIDKGIFSLRFSNPFYNVCKVKRFYYLTNDFQGYDYYVWLPYKYYLECIKVIRLNYNTTNSPLPLIIYL